MEDKINIEQNSLTERKIPVFASIAIIFAIGMLCVFFSLAGSPESFTAYGTIVADNTPFQVASPINGSIDKIEVKDGQKVKYGQALFTINTDKIDKIIKGKPIKAGSASVFGSQLEILPPVPALGNRNIPLSNRGMEERQNREQTASEVNYEELYKQGVISKKELEAFKLKFASEKQEQKEETSPIENQTEIKAKKEAAKAIAPGKIYSERSAAQFSSSIVIFKKKTIFAPIDGIVKLQSSYNPGDTIKSKEIILSIIQNHQKLYGDVKISSKNISDIRLNQRVMFKIPNLAGSIFGNVMSIKVCENNSDFCIVRIKPDEKTFSAAPVLKPKTRIAVVFGKF